MAFSAAGGHDDVFAIDEWGLAVVPAALLAAELFDEVVLPDWLAVLVDAGEVALLAEGVDAVAVDGRRAAEAAAGRADGGGPEDVALLAVEGNEVRLAGLVAEGVDAVAGDADGGESAAEPLRGVEEFRTVFGPAL